MRTSMTAILLTTSLLAASVSARAIETWSYDRLFCEADIVVIASAQATVQSDDPTPDGAWKTSLVGQRATFAVIAKLKGKDDAGTVTVRHFRPKDGVLTQDGPMLVSFRTDGPRSEGGTRVKYVVKLSTPQYLLFLKRSQDGPYEPVSGQTDSALSVKEIYAPLPEVMDK
jgi:hypothetical protein